MARILVIDESQQRAVEICTGLIKAGHHCVMNQTMPRPVVMFSQDGDSATIRSAVRAGMAAYVVDGFEIDRLKQGTGGRQPQAFRAQDHRKGQPAALKRASIRCVYKRFRTCAVRHEAQVPSRKH